MASIPEPVGYSVLLASFCQMLGFGLKDYARLEFNSRDYFVVGLPVLFGTGVMNLPAGSFEDSRFRPVHLGNGFVVGMLLCMLLEHVLLPKKYFSWADLEKRGISDLMSKKHLWQRMDSYNRCHFYLKKPWPYLPGLQ